MLCAGPYPVFKVWSEKHILGGQNFCFICMFKTIFSGATKFWGAKKICGGTAAECPLMATGMVTYIST